MKKPLASSTRACLVSLLLATLVSWSSLWSPASTRSTTSVAEAAQNPYELAVGSFQHTIGASDDLAWSKVKDAAHVAFIQRNWQEADNPGGATYYDAVASQVSLAKSKGLKIYLGLDLLSPDRASLELPAALQGLSGGFGNKQIQDAYIALVRKVAADFQPQYFIIAVEINMYSRNNPTDYSAYKALYAAAYSAVKSVSPLTQVAASLLYSDYNGLNCIDSADKALFQSHVADFNNRRNVSDIFAVSTYPFCYFSPAAIPTTFLSELASFSSRPLFISETGWISSPYQITPAFAFPSDQSAQSAYVTRLSQLTEYARTRGRTIRAITYISIVDPDSAYCARIESRFPQNSWYCILSLMDAQSVEKTALGTMRLWKGRLGG